MRDLSRVTITHNEAEFLAKNEFVMDQAVEQMANDALILAQLYVPFEFGDLRESGEVERIKAMMYTLWFDKDGDLGYAAAQEAGTTRGIAIKNYTKPGTGAHYTERACNKVASQAMNYFQQAATKLAMTS